MWQYQIPASLLDDPDGRPNNRENQWWYHIGDYREEIANIEPGNGQDFVVIDPWRAADLAKLGVRPEDIADSRTMPAEECKWYEAGGNIVRPAPP